MDVSFRGYVSKPQTVTSKSGRSYHKYVVGVKQKDKQSGGVTWANLFVTDFKSDSAPEAKAYVTGKAYLKVKEYEKDGQKRTLLDAVLSEPIEVAPPLGGSDGGGGGSPSKAAEKDPWED